MSTPPRKPREDATPPAAESSHSAKALMAAAVALLVLLMLLAALWLKPTLLPPGWGEKLWYVLTVLLGFACAVSLFTLFRSYARYNGKAMNGTLQIGGPGVLMLVIVVLGFVLPPPSSTKFDMTVFLTAPDDKAQEALQGTELSMHVGTDPRTGIVEAKGLVRFVGIPAEMLGRPAPVALKAPLLALTAGPATTLKLTSGAVYLDVSWKPWQLEGQVLDEKGQGLAGAEVFMAGQKAGTDTSGRFSLSLSTKLPQSKRMLEVKLQGFAPWRNSIAAGTDDVQVQLTRTQ